MQAGATHEALKPLCWLIGKWRSICAEGKYPTVDPFKYCEELTYKSLGHPMLVHKSVTWDPKSKFPMHLESGFLCIKPCTNQVALVLAHNFGCQNIGYATVEEGCVEGEQIIFNSTGICRMKFCGGSPLKEFQRCLKLNEKGQLEALVCMATCDSPMCEHFRAVYEKSC